LMFVGFGHRILPGENFFHLEVNYVKFHGRYPT